MPLFSSNMVVLCCCRKLTVSGYLSFEQLDHGRSFYCGSIHACSCCTDHITFMSGITTCTPASAGHLQLFLTQFCWLLTRQGFSLASLLTPGHCWSSRVNGSSPCICKAYCHPHSHWFIINKKQCPQCSDQSFSKGLWHDGLQCS